MAFGSNQSFEPRVGTAQLVFGVIYLLVTLIALSLAFYVRASGTEPYIHYFMAGLFAIMAIKSFIIANRIKKLLKEGVYYEAKLDSCEPVRGITVLKGVVEVENYGPIYIESRLVGEKIAHEINNFMRDNQQDCLPAIVVAANTKRPRGMFTVRGLHGHLVPSSAMLKSKNYEDVKEQNKDNLAFASDTQKAKAQTKEQEQMRQEQNNEDNVPSVAPRDDKKDQAIMDALYQAEKKTQDNQE